MTYDVAMSDDPSVFDNIEAAMNDLAEDMKTRDMTVSKEAEEKDPADKQVIVRTTKEEHERWKRAAESAGVSLSQMVRDQMNKAASVTLDCQHPREFRKSYPWAEFCLKCNARLRG